MEHTSYVIAELELDGEEFDMIVGDLVVVRHPDGPLDWELISRTEHRAPVAQSPYKLSMQTAEGRQLRGPAFLVRSDGLSHVWRGAGPLGGFDPGDFRDPGH
jgi:hypothetical protein